MNAISVKNLNKTFASTAALKDVSFAVRPGSITGFLGPNGAGKSTMMNILLGFIGASSGSAAIFGRSVGVNAIETRRGLGFLSSNMALSKNLAVAEELKLYGYLGGGYDADYVEELASQLDLDLSAKIGHLSTGNYQKTGLVIALMNRPKQLLLDEPTNGLDPLVQAEFNKIILNLKQSGSTVFISSHILSEIETLCDDFIFIKEGRIAAQMTRQEITARAGQIISIKPTTKNRPKILDFLNKNQIKYDTHAGDLEQTFMGFYENNPTKKGK
jgi:ABC-2 type transport system ATP-binding protein